MSAKGLMSVAVAMTLSAHAAAGHAATGGYYVSVPVIDAVPVTSRRTVERPVEQCRSVDYSSRAYGYREDRRRHPHPGGGVLPGIFGGLVGGLIGNQFGGGNGRTALTVIGALAGSSIARNASAERYDGYSYRDYTPVQRCETRYETRTIEQVVGYDVTYAYAGRQFVKRTEEHPGDEIRIRVEVDPLLE